MSLPVPGESRASGRTGVSCDGQGGMETTGGGSMAVGTRRRRSDGSSGSTQGGRPTHKPQGAMLGPPPPQPPPFFSSSCFLSGSSTFSSGWGPRWRCWAWTCGLCAPRPRSCHPASTSSPAPPCWGYPPAPSTWWCCRGCPWCFPRWVGWEEAGEWVDGAVGVGVGGLEVGQEVVVLLGVPCSHRVGPWAPALLTSPQRRTPLAETCLGRLACAAPPTPSPSHPPALLTSPHPWPSAPDPSRRGTAGPTPTPAPVPSRRGTAGPHPHPCARSLSPRPSWAGWPS